jgi:hypothetical protein
MSGDPPDRPDDDTPVTLTTRPTAFEAHAIVAALEGAGIAATAIDAPGLETPSAFGAGGPGVPVRVRAGDLDAARAVLASDATADAIDWNDVDVGERADRLPLHPPGRRPLMARVALVVAIVVVIVMLAVAIAVVVTTPSAP